MSEGIAAPGMGRHGTTERELWIAGCAERDLAAGAEHPDVTPDWARSSMRDGAKAIRALTLARQYRGGDELLRALEAGLEYAIEAANSCKTKDRRFEQMMNDIRRIESEIERLRGIVR